MNNKNIINQVVSYKANEIYDWCKYQIQNNTDFSSEADELFEQYWGEYAVYEYKPASNVYYFVWYERSSVGFKVVRLERDIEKSPRRNQTR